MADGTAQGHIPTEGIKYAGSKLRIIPYIQQLVSGLDGVHTVLDGFSGTTRVAQAFARMGFDTAANDCAVWSEVFATCYLKARGDDRYYRELIDHLNGLPGYDGWFTEHYGADTARAKRPFQRKNTRRLDAIRDEIDRLGLEWEDRCVLLTSLIRALDAVDNTLGHYAAYLAQWSARSYRDLCLRLPARCPSQGVHEVTRGDVFDAAVRRGYDLAYYDPPYGSNNEKMPPSRVRYASYYHLWTTVIRNDHPPLFGKANRREDSRDTVAGSVFEEFRRNADGRFIALEALERLIRTTRARYVLLSYSSGGRATKAELHDIIASSGRLLQSVEIDYRKNVMAGMRWTGEWINSDSPCREYLFLMEKNV